MFSLLLDFALRMNSHVVLYSFASYELENTVLRDVCLSDDSISTQFSAPVYRLRRIRTVVHLLYSCFSTRTHCTHAASTPEFVSGLCWDRIDGSVRTTFCSDVVLQLKRVVCRLPRGRLRSAELSITRNSCRLTG